MLIILAYCTLAFFVTLAWGKLSLKLASIDSQPLQPDILAIIGLCALTLIGSIKVFNFFPLVYLYCI